MNRAKQSETEEIEAPRAVKSKTVPLLDTFRGTVKPVVGDGVWKERGQALLWYDAEDQLISVEVTNNESANLEELFSKMCNEQALYQLNLPEYDLMTT
jgi:hypothetical protein